MLWRRFSVLLRGLGPNSASAHNAWARRQKSGLEPAPGEVVIRGKEATTAAFSSQFSKYAATPKQG